MGADSSKAKAGRKGEVADDAGVRCLKLRRSSKSPSVGGQRGSSTKSRGATGEEVLLATRLIADSSPPECPPFYAVSSEWLFAWRSFATGGGRPPGPIANSGLIAAGDGTGSSPSARDVAVSWLSGDDWHLLHSRHGGGPVLRRTSCELFASGTGGGAAEGDAAAGQCVASTEPLALVQRRAALLKQRCQTLSADLAAEIRRLERGPWAKIPSKAARAARGRVASAVSTACGGEELREALQVLRAAGEGTALATLDALVAELCSLEEAMIVLACLLQALEQEDRTSLELWLEQADLMALEVMAADAPLIEPLRRRLAELEERERRALAGHASAVSEDEGPGERLWRQVLFAVEANDEVTLIELISEAEQLGLDTASAQLALEELRGRRQESEEQEFGLPTFERPTGYLRTGEVYPPRARPAAGGGDAAGGGQRSTPANSGEGPIFGDPSNYRNTEDFLNDYRRWREQHPTTAEEQERRRNSAPSRPGSSAAQERQYRRWQDEPRDTRRRDEEDERSRIDLERRRREERERGERNRREEERAAQEREDRQRAERERADRERWYREEQERRRREREEQEWRERYRRRTTAPAAVGRPADDALRTLGLPTGRVPPLAELKTAYRKAAMKSHPDRPQNRGRQAEATAEFQRVKAAFDLLAPGAGG